MSRRRGGRQNRENRNGQPRRVVHDLVSRPSGRETIGGQQHLVSNGPAGKVRGSAQTIAAHYLQQANTAQRNGDAVLAETLFQYAEHYVRIAGPSFASAEPAADIKFDEPIPAHQIPRAAEPALSY